MEHLTRKVSRPIIPQKKGSFFRKKDAVIIQPKLTINKPNDPYEQEADAVADRVMRMSDHENLGQPFFRPRVASLQRMCADCEEEEKMTQRKEVDRKETTTNHSLESYVGHLNSGGHALPDDVRDYYEPRFGYDFSHVKVHTDGVAAQSAQSINALAYTSGSNIVFNHGQYDPGSVSGKKLLGHELTHVIQQGTGLGLSSIQRQTPFPQPCPTTIASSTYSRGNDDWAECNYETARIQVDLVLDSCSCDFSGSYMPLSVNYSAILEGKNFTGRTIPNPSGTGTIREQEGQASHIASGVATPGRSRVGGTPPGMTLSEGNLPPGSPPNTSAPLALDIDDARRGGRPGDPGDTVSQQLSFGGIPCSGGSKSGQVNLGGGFQEIRYDVSADSTGVQQASISLNETGRMAGRIPTPLINLSTGSPYPPFPGVTRPGGTGCTCNSVTGGQVGGGCNRGTGGAGFGRP